jgi:hypothetical protein
MALMSRVPKLFFICIYYLFIYSVSKSAQYALKYIPVKHLWQISGILKYKSDMVVRNGCSTHVLVVQR